MKRVHDMPFGARVLADGKVRFRLWAPAARTVELCLENPAGEEIILPMKRLTDGGFLLETSVSDHTFIFRCDGGAFMSVSCLFGKQFEAARFDSLVAY